MSFVKCTITQLSDEYDDDYMIVINDASCLDEGIVDDAIGFKDVDGDTVLKPLGIETESMENTFMWDFDDDFKDLEAVKTHLKSHGWYVTIGDTI